MLLVRFGLVLAASLSPLACSGEAVLCPAIDIPSIQIEIRDESGAAAAHGAAGEALRRIIRPYAVEYVAYPLSDRWSPSDTLFLFGGSGVGTFNVSVTKAGYQEWTAFGVVVESAGDGQCAGHVTAQLEARLQRLP